MLKQQWCAPNARACRRRDGVILAPSDTVRYTFAAPTAPCTTNPVQTLSIGGQPVANDGSQSYRITVNSFLADGGDGFSVLTGGTNRLGGVGRPGRAGGLLRGQQPGRAPGAEPHQRLVTAAPRERRPATSAPRRPSPSALPAAARSWTIRRG